MGTYQTNPSHSLRLGLQILRTGLIMPCPIKDKDFRLLGQYLHWVHLLSEFFPRQARNLANHKAIQEWPTALLAVRLYQPNSLILANSINSGKTLDGGIADNLLIPGRRYAISTTLVPHFRLASNVAAPLETPVRKPA